VLNDQSNNFGLLSYYIRKQDQIAQLRATGFRPLQVLDRRGAPLCAGELSRDPWLCYVARRVSRAVQSSREAVAQEAL
ncbi:MAG: hypothetical protein ACREXU_18420, partial [Gammaproteobacteria bacterium]